jgi:peptidyl-prolyl cis-trans isomerase D
MAVLSNIRQRSVLLILVIGFCLFAFIIGDLFSSGSFNNSSRYVGSVNGKDILFEDFRMKVSNMEKSGQGISSTQAANQVWNQEISIALLSEEFDALGLRVGEAQIMEVLKQSQDIGQNPMFLNEQGQFDQGKFDEFFRSNPEQKRVLADRKKDAEINAKFQMYASLVKGGLYTTGAEGKLKYEMESNKVTFDYVPVLYSTIKDSDAKVTDQEIVDYMKAREKRFKADESREIEFVLIEDKPSSEDEAEITSELNALLAPRVAYNDETKSSDTIPSFQQARNIGEFINEYSDVPYDSTYIAKKDLPAEHAEKLFNLAPGQLYGPYRQGDYLCVSKLVSRQAGASAKASHILIAYKGAMRANPAITRTKEEAQEKANDLLTQIMANQDSFAMQAFTNSDDPGSQQQGGDLGYFSQGQMTGKFNDFVFGNAIGRIGMVETEFGYHIIKVTDKQDAIRLATLAKKIEASESTVNKTYTVAQNFETAAKEKSFEEAAKAQKLTVNAPVRVSAMDEYFGPLGNQRAIVQWAFNKDTKKGDIKRFEVANVGYVIAKVKNVFEEGLMAIDQARPQIEPILKNKKKAEIIRKKMTGSSLDAIAKANNTSVKTATDLTVENAVLEGVGMESKVVGAAIATAVNKVSQPIEGVSGVYVVMPKAVTKAPALKAYTDYTAKLRSQNASAPGRIIPALRENAEIKDNRKLFF